MITAIILALMFFVSGASLAQETVGGACSIVDAPMVSLDGDPLLLANMQTTQFVCDAMAKAS